MISHLELRHIIESGFLPLKCFCEVSPNGTLTVQLTNPDTHEVELTVPGISTAPLITSRGINNLIAEIKEEYALLQVVRKGKRSVSSGRG